MPEDVAPLPPPIQVLLVVDDDVYNRLGNVVQYLCVGLIDEPVQTRVLMRTTGVRSPDTIGPAHVLTVRCRRWHWGRRWPSHVLEALNDTPPDVIHCLSAGLCQWVQRLGVIGDPRLLVHVTDLEDAKALRHILAERGPSCITATPRLHARVMQRWPAWSERFRLIPFGVPAEEEPACLDQPERVPAAVLLTPLTRDCGFEGVLRALQATVRGGQEMQLFVLSTGPAEASFRRRADQLDLRRYVSFASLGSDRDTANAALHGADFFIEPNPARRFSAQMLAAMATGLAILAPHGTLEDYLIDGTTACLFDPLDWNDLATKWNRLLQDRSAARRLAQSAMDYVRAHHQASTMVSATAALYRDLRTGNR